MAQKQPRGATPHLRSRGAAERSEDERSYPASKVRGGDNRSYPAFEVRGSGREEISHAPTPEAKGGGLEDQPHIRGALAARAQEGLEELFHVEGQEGWRWGDTRRPR